MGGCNIFFSPLCQLVFCGIRYGEVDSCKLFKEMEAVPLFLILPVSVVLNLVFLEERDEKLGDISTEFPYLLR